MHGRYAQEQGSVRVSVPAQQSTRLVTEKPDKITSKELKTGSPKVAKAFLMHVIVTLVFGFALTGVTVAQAVIDPWWTLWMHAIAAVRTLMLLSLAIGMCTCVRIKLHQLYGTGDAYQPVTALRPLPLLAFWRIFGYVDLFVGRVAPLLADGVFVATHTGDLSSAPMTRIGVDIAFIMVYFIDIWLIESQGIRANIRRRLLTRRVAVA